MLPRTLVASGLTALVIIVATALIVFDRSPAGRPNALSAVGSAGLDEAEVPDPEARGVVVLSQDYQLYSYTADGEAFGGPFPAPYETGLSPDGEWYAYRHCPNPDTCMLVVLPAKGTPRIDDFADYAVKMDAAFVSGEWARSGATLAALDESGALYRVDPASRTAEQVQACCVTAYAWTADDELLMAGQGKDPSSWLGLVGEPAAAFHHAPARIDRLFESPDATRFAFAQSDAQGLRLMSLDSTNGRLTDYGVLQETPAADGTSFAIAWSRDQRYIAVGPIAAPYRLYVLDTLTSELAATYDFEEGYAGELAWSPTANRLAISTYSPDRLRHEVYVVDPAAGEAPRHLLSGCKIVWSPDGRFLAAKSEPHTLGAAAVNVDSGRHWQLSRIPGATPVSWGADEASALSLVQVPGRSAAVLGK